jgi:hypothetical protein
LSLAEGHDAHSLLDLSQSIVIGCHHPVCTIQFTTMESVWRSKIIMFSRDFLLFVDIKSETFFAKASQKYLKTIH